MEMELKALLEEYKEYTMKLWNCLTEDDYDSLEFYMNKRQHLLDLVCSQNYSKEQFAKMFDELGLGKYEQKLVDLFAVRKEEIKDNINALTKSRNANSVYNRNVTGAVVFSKKI